MRTEQAAPAACNLVLFGITGDLARRKLLGALYHLDKGNLLHPGTRILGLAHGNYNAEEFRALALNSLMQFVGSNLDQEVLRRLLQRFSYRGLEFADAQAYASLNDWFTEQPQSSLFYFATPAAMFSPICQGLHAAQLIAPDSRVIMEKPIGDSLLSSRAVNDTVGAYFSEKQIYRIDHYLGKETVLNLLVLRFANA
ncbi:MAG: glucose-6-phosphate dehydrogenase, partial [Pseudomonadales bacterium]|nr:glucose-6-phosphate dehydrogenase [Pseudomonadales bacterium]